MFRELTAWSRYFKAKTSGMHFSTKVLEKSTEANVFK